MFWKIAEALWIKKPVPVLTNPSTLPKSPIFEDVDTRDRSFVTQIRHLEWELSKQKLITSDLNSIVEYERHEHVKISRVIATISASVWFLIWWTTLSLYWQSSPNSEIQRISSWVVKIVSSDKTWYEMLVEKSKKDDVIREQKEIIKAYKELSSSQQEMLKTESQTLKEVSWKVVEIMAEIQKVKEDLAMIWTKPQTQVKPEVKNASVEKKSKMELVIPTKEEKKVDFELSSNNSEVFSIVSRNIEDIKSDLPEWFNVKYIKTKEWRINVWTEFMGKKSLWYYADSPKFKDRLDKKWFKNWIVDRYNNFLMIEQLKNIALEKQISLSKNDSNTPIYIQIEETYAWNLKVILFDKSMNRTGSFLANWLTDNEKTLNIKMNKVIDSFLI